MTINTFDVNALDPMRRKVFHESYKWEIGRRIFDVANRALDARTALAIVNTADQDIVTVLHPQTADMGKLAEFFEKHPYLSLYDPKAK